MRLCPSCHSEKTRRGGMTIWITYLVLVALAIPAVLVLELNAALVAGVMIAVIVIVNLVSRQRVCTDCGHQFRDAG